MRTLRNQLFRSHLLVMVVALGVLVLGLGLSFAVARAVFVDDSRDDPVAGGDKVKDDVDSETKGGGDNEHDDEHDGGDTHGGGEGGGDNGPPNPVVLLLPLAAAASAAGFVSWRVARRLAAPIEATRHATRQLAAGRYDVEVDGGSTTELAGLASDVNRLGADLRAIEQRRLRLVGDVAHELRNPLATIEASMEALMDGVVPASDETFTGVAREAARLRRLAGDLSELSATAEPSAVNLTDRVDLVAVIGHVIEQLSAQATAKGLNFNWSPSGNVIVIGDRDRLTQVFTNIIGNAVQYTDDGAITVSVGPTADGPGHCRVAVADTGRGLATDDLALIFERFHRVDRSGEGTGVGLAIAKSLVEAHGGLIDVASDGPGHGTTFTITLPRVAGSVEV